MFLTRNSIAARASLLCFTALFGFAPLAPAPAVAQEAVIFDGSKARVNLASKLRSLSQQIAADSCQISAGIDADRAREDMLLSRTTFVKILDALQNGDTGLGVPSAEDFSRILNAIDDVRAKWQPMDKASSDMLGNNDPDAAAAVIAQTNDALLESAVLLLSEVSAHYSNPAELLQGDAMALNIAGRQRMLIDKVDKEVCGIASSLPELGTVDTLNQTMSMFDVSLYALRDGMPDAGLSPPPNEAIKKELQSVVEQWGQIKPELDGIAAGGAASADQVVSIRATSEEILREMQNVVTLYMLSTPGQEDVYRVPLRAFAEAELAQWLLNPELIAEIKAQNAEHAALGQDAVDALDLEWRAQEKAGGGPLLDKLLGKAASDWLLDKQNGTAGFVTEVFVMDDKGLNVAQSVVTSDYWQGDEAKWKETIGDGLGRMHISEVEFDDSTGFYQSQVSLPIRDPATGALIGAITFGINVQRLL